MDVDPYLFIWDPSFILKYDMDAYMTIFFWRWGEGFVLESWVEPKNYIQYT